MPITTILQHQMDRERVNQPAPDTPTTEDDHNTREQDTTKQETTQDFRTECALALEKTLKISLLPNEEKKATVTGQWGAPNSTFRTQLFNGPKSSRSSAAPSSTEQVSSVNPKANQTTPNRPIADEKVTAPPRATTLDGHNTGQVPPANHDPRQSPRGMQQSRQTSCASYQTRQVSSPDYHVGPPSPTDSVYEAARRAVNVVAIRKTRELAPKANDARQAFPNAHINGQTVPRACSTLPTPVTSHRNARAPILNHSGGQPSHASHHPPLMWNAIQTPDSHKAKEARDRLRAHEAASRTQPSGGICRPLTSMQQQRPQPSNVQRPKSAAARRRAMLKHSVTYTLPVASPQTPAAPEQPVVSQPSHPQPHYSQSCHVQPANSGPAHSQPYSSHPACSQPGCPQPYHSQPAYSRPVSAPQHANDLHPVTASQSLPTSQPMNAPNPTAATRRVGASQGMPPSHPTINPHPIHPLQLGAASQSALRQETGPQLVMALRPAPTSYPRLMPKPAPASQQETVVKQFLETPGERRRRLKREALLRTKNTCPGQDRAASHEPQQSSILGMLPSVGNRVVEHLMKHNPSAVAASKLSHTIPRETAVHYNSVLTWQAQNAQAIAHSSPHEHPTHFDGVESRTVPSYGAPASREAQNMELVAVHGRSMPVSQQPPNTENSPRHSRSGTLVPQHGFQSRPYSNAPSGELNNAPNRYTDYALAPTQQNRDAQGRRTSAASSYGDIQEVSRMDWQAANRKGSRPHVGQRAHSVVVSAAQKKTMAPSASASSVNSESIPTSCVNESNDNMLPPETRRPIRQKAVANPAQAQTSKKPAGQAQPKPASGGVQKKKSSRARRTSPPKTTVSPTVVPQAPSRRITISQLVLSPAELANMVASQTGAPQAVAAQDAMYQAVAPQAEMYPAATYQAVAPQPATYQAAAPQPETYSAATYQAPHAEMYQAVAPQAEMYQAVTYQAMAPQAMVSQAAMPQVAMPQVAMPQTAPRTPLPSGRQDKQRPVRLPGSGVWLTEDEVEQWQEERGYHCRLPSFRASFGDVHLMDYAIGPEHQASIFSFDAYRPRPGTSFTNYWLWMVNN